jgi:hypothetical protein
LRGLRTGGTLLPGIAGAGVVNTHNVSLTSGNTFRMQLGGPPSLNSLLNVTGTEALHGALDVTLTAATPYVTSVRSRKFQGAACPFDIMLGAVPFPSN